VQAQTFCHLREYLQTVFIYVTQIVKVWIVTQLYTVVRKITALREVVTVTHVEKPSTILWKFFNLEEIK